MLMVKVTVKAQYFFEYLFGWYLLNHLTFCSQTWSGDASSSATVWKGCFAIFKVKVTELILSEYDRFIISSELVILLQPNLVLWYIIINWCVLLKD